MSDSKDFYERLDEEGYILLMNCQRGMKGRKELWLSEWAMNRLKARNYPSDRPVSLREILSVLKRCGKPHKIQSQEETKTPGGYRLIVEG